MKVDRFDANPLVTADAETRVGENVNGPSLVRAPEWVDDPLGAYYLYFAHHGGDHVRVAYADDLCGPWRIHEPGTLDLADTAFDDHVASPDVHVDPATETVRMYFHGCCGSYVEDGVELSQFTRLATSADGLSFSTAPAALGRFYFRAFRHEGTWYALAKANIADDPTSSGLAVYRSPDGRQFERGPTLHDETVRAADDEHRAIRHVAVRTRGDALDVFYSRIGDAPERILRAEVELAEPWSDWDLSAPEEVLEPERDYEGANLPVEPSESGPVHDPVRQVRDPAVYEEDGRTYLLYSVAGEQGIAGAELRE
jgi:hypothetical protein